MLDSKLYILKQLLLSAYNFPRYAGSSPLGVYLAEVSLNFHKTSKFKRCQKAIQICGQYFSSPERMAGIKEIIY